MVETFVSSVGAEYTVEQIPPFGGSIQNVTFIQIHKIYMHDGPSQSYMNTPSVSK